MFRCIVAVELPIYLEDNPTTPVSFSFAEYSFDPGLKQGDIVRAENVALTKRWKNDLQVEPQGPKFSFEALIKERQYYIDKFTDENGSVVDRLSVWLISEVADKEQLPEMIQDVKDFHVRINSPYKFI